MRLRTPPSSPCKPRVSGTAPNRAFLRGFPTTDFPDFCLCERSPILAAIFGGLSPHPKIPFPAAVVVDLARNSDSERRPWLRGSEPCDDRHRRTAVLSTDGRSRSV